MATPAGTVTSHDAKGNRESLDDVISNIAPTDTPFLTMCKKGKNAKATKEEWLLDDLAAADKDNAALDGDDAESATFTPTDRVANYTQIFTKTIQVSGTQEAVDSAGRKSEISYQTMKKGKELKRDIEAAFLSNNGSVAGNNATPRKLGGMEAWIETNVDGGTGYADGGFSGGVVSPATDGAQRAFAESQIKDVMQKCFTEGGKPTQMYMPPKQKQKFSAFPGIAELRKEAPGQKAATVVGAVDIYVSDFGTLHAVPSIFMRDRTSLIIDPSMVEKRHLRPTKRNKLAKTGDSEKYQLVCEVTLACRNEKAHGKIADLN